MSIQQVVDAVLNSGAHTGVKYLTNKQVIRCTRRHKLDKRGRRVEFVVTIGAPNYREREFISMCFRTGEKLPVRKVQLRFKKHKHV